jgi:hypothetical protein
VRARLDDLHKCFFGVLGSKNSQRYYDFYSYLGNKYDSSSRIYGVISF